MTNDLGLLFATEIDFERRRGIVGVYDLSKHLHLDCRDRSRHVYPIRSLAVAGQISGHQRSPSRDDRRRKDRDIVSGLGGYVGSIALDSAGGIAAASSPHGNAIAFRNLKSGRGSGLSGLPYICGVAPCRAQGKFIASTVPGRLIEFDTVSGNVHDLKESESSALG